MEPKQKGISLMEILVSLLILCVGLLGIMKMQVYSLQATNNAYYTSQALIRLQSFNAIQKLHPNNMNELYSQWQKVNAMLLPESSSVRTARGLTLSWFDPYIKTKQTIVL